MNNSQLFNQQFETGSSQVHDGGPEGFIREGLGWVNQSYYDDCERLDFDKDLEFPLRYFLYSPPMTPQSTLADEPSYPPLSIGPPISSPPESVGRTIRSVHFSTPPPYDVSAGGSSSPHDTIRGRGGPTTTSASTIRKKIVVSDRPKASPKKRAAYTRKGTASLKKNAASLEKADGPSPKEDLPKATGSRKKGYAENSAGPSAKEEGISTTDPVSPRRSQRPRSPRKLYFE